MSPPQMSSTPSHGGSSVSFYITIFLFAVISFLLYKFVLSPAPTEPQTRIANSTSSTVVTQRNAPRANLSSSTGSSANISNDEYFSYGTNRHPPHFIPPEKWDKSTSLSKYLLQGIVPFRSTPANGYETRLQKDSLSADDLVVVNRKERARIFARLFSLTASEDGSKMPPPNRGANIVVTVYPHDASCDKLQKALMLLGTYYNLFVMVDGSEVFWGKQQKDQRDYVCKFREEMLNTNNEVAASESFYKLNSQVLPPHRIVFSATTAGRVAFVRQLNGVELVVDGEVKVTRELKRFGHRVLVYPPKGDSVNSALGKFLIP
jgi:hypothetical protein